MISILIFVASRRRHQPWVRLSARDTAAVRLSTRDTAATSKSFLSSHIFIFVPSGCVLSRERNIGRLSNSWAHAVDYKILFGFNVYGTSKRQPLLAFYLLVFLTPILLPPLLPLPRPLLPPPQFPQNFGEYALYLIVSSFD